MIIAGGRRYLAIGCAMLMTASLLPRDTYARGFDTGLAIGVGAAIIGGLLASGNRNAQAGVRRETRGTKSAKKSRARQNDTAARGNESSSSPSNDQVLASLAGPAGKVSLPVLATFRSSTVTGSVGTVSENDNILKLRLKDEERDYSSKMTAILQRFQTENKDRRSGDVTALAIETALDEAVRKSRLDQFESFLNENWTTDRLRVMILNRVIGELPSLFNGNNRGLAPMATLHSLIQRSAEAIYVRLFEASELLAANKSIVTFQRRVYEAQGNGAAPINVSHPGDAAAAQDTEHRLSEELRERADSILSKAAKLAISRYEAAFRLDPNSFALRYRAQRVMYDCLSEYVEEITTSASATTLAEIPEIERRAFQTALNTCNDWLVVTFGESLDKLKEQKPYPIRVIWSAGGPKDEPKLYGRTNRSL